MPFATFRGEQSVAELTNKLFAKLTPAQRKQAEAAILKANPGLRDIRKLKPGTVLTIPKVPGVRAPARRDLENPEDSVADLLTDVLTDFGKRFAARADAERTGLQSQLDLLKNRDFVKATSDNAELQETAKKLQTSLKGRVKLSEQREKTVAAALDQALKDLEARAR